jgi:hypothetical protein
MTHVHLSRYPGEELEAPDWILIVLTRVAQLNNRDVVLARHFSKLARLTDLSQAKLDSFECNGFVIGWETEALKSTFIDFIKDLIEDKNYIDYC